MIKKFYPSSLYNFLWYIQSNSVKRRILDCGAGGPDPKLAFFYENGFESYGIDISDDQIKEAQDYCKNSGDKLNIIKGDMKKIPFESNFFGYAYSYLSMVHLSKTDTKIAINEMHRVLMNGGLCYLNFLSQDDALFDKTKETNPGEVVSKHEGQEFIHSYYEDEEPDGYFDTFDILYKEKRTILKGKYFNTGRNCILDYIVKK